jgi:cell division control protein 11
MPPQIRRKKNVKKGIQFCLMVCGASGTGKCRNSLVVSYHGLCPFVMLNCWEFLGRTTFVNTLCGKKVLQSKDSDDSANAHVEEGVRIKPVTVGRCFRVVSPGEFA